MKNPMTALWWGVVLVTLLSAGGCKDKAKCSEAEETTKKALAVDDTALARQWRERTWKMCGDKGKLAAIDQEILAKEEEIANRAVLAAQKAHDDAQAKVDELKRLWVGVDKLDMFRATGKKFEKDKLLAEIKNAYAEGKRMLNGIDDAYAKDLLKFNNKLYKRRLAALEEKSSPKKK
jgi:hypothetical protein